MATMIPKNSVWAAMSYVPPRGRCNYKTSLMSPACPCLRFMLHPVKASTSFECDGCQHHASFHSLENPDEDAVLKKWEEQENRFVLQKQATIGASRKRKRVAAKPHNEEQLSDVVEVVEDTDEVDAEAEEQLQEELVGAKRKRGKK